MWWLVLESGRWEMSFWACLWGLSCYFSWGADLSTVGGTMSTGEILDCVNGERKLSGSTHSSLSVSLLWWVPSEQCGQLLWVPGALSSLPWWTIWCELKETCSPLSDFCRRLFFSLLNKRSLLGVEVVPDWSCMYASPWYQQMSSRALKTI